jgi:hypothetical protein
MNTESKKILYKRNWKESIQEENWNKIGTGLKRWLDDPHNAETAEEEQDAKELVT